jgi:hypothetical protein
MPILSIPVAERSKARVYGHSLAGITGLNPAECMDVCVMWMLCVDGIGLCKGLFSLPDKSCRLRCAVVRNKGALASVGLLRQGEEIEKDTKSTWRTLKRLLY